MMKQVIESRRLLLLRAGLVGNITFLCLFKYINFLFRSIAFFHGPALHFPDWGFPLGLSFFTLTQIMYLVDTYQGLNSANSLFDHATFVSLFPYVTSGPLVRARSIVSQFSKPALAEERLALACRGLYLFSLGALKKIVLADSFAAVADAGFTSIRNYSILEAWIFAFAYLLQLYFDFSGYSDMAVGSAWMLGIDIPQNFNAPLRARSISEFWQRWHISLSNFITNYLYTPMLRSFPKATLSASVLSTVAAMTIVGLWHGPAWTFVLYGLSHGIALAANQIWKKRKLKMPDWAGLLVTQFFVAASLVFFRSPDVPSALHMLNRLLPHADPLSLMALKGVIPLSFMLPLRPLFWGTVAAFFFKSSLDASRTFEFSWRYAAGTAGLVVICLFYMNSAAAKPFVYFNF